MATGLSLHIGLNGVDPKHYAGWDGELRGLRTGCSRHGEVGHRARLHPD